MKRLLWLIAVSMLVSSQESLAARKDGMEWQLFGRYMKESTSFSTTGTGDANYSGRGLGFGTLLKISTPQRYGFAVKAGMLGRKGDNSANTSAALESLSSSVYDVGLRFYALDVFFGFSAIYAPISTSYTAGGTLTERKYNGIGAGLELGVDLFLGDTFFVSPKFEYQTMSAQPATGTTNAERLSTMGFGVSLGFAF